MCPLLNVTNFDRLIQNRAQKTQRNSLSYLEESKIEYIQSQKWVGYFKK